MGWISSGGLRQVEARRAVPWGDLRASGVFLGTLFLGPAPRSVRTGTPVARAVAEITHALIISRRSWRLLRVHGLGHFARYALRAAGRSGQVLSGGSLRAHGWR
jgi:hypothetical protein